MPFAPMRDCISEELEAKTIDLTDFRTESIALEEVVEMEEDALDDDLQ